MCTVLFGFFFFSFFSIVISDSTREEIGNRLKNNDSFLAILMIWVFDGLQSFGRTPNGRSRNFWPTIKAAGLLYLYVRTTACSNLPPRRVDCRLLSKENRSLRSSVKRKQSQIMRSELQAEDWLLKLSCFVHCCKLQNCDTDNTLWNQH